MGGGTAGDSAVQIGVFHEARRSNRDGKGRISDKWH